MTQLAVRPSPDPRDTSGSRSDRAVGWAMRHLGWVSAARVVLVVSLLIWVRSLHGMSDAPVSQYGLLFSHGGGLLVATLGVVLAFALALRRDSTPDAVAAVLALVAVTRATASIITGLPLFTWTFKHIGVVEHLTSTGGLARNVDIYNNWPGFFTTAAWFSEITGVAPITVARWFPVVADLAIVLGMYAVSRAFGQSRRVALVAAFAVQALNWVGQDYYSPQALGFVLALALIALLLRSPQSRAAGWLSVPVFLAITVTHQLTPFWLVAVALLLGATRRITPRWVGLVYLAIAVAYLLANLSALTPYGLLSGFDPVANAQSNVATAGNAGREFTAIATKVTALALWGGAGVIALYRRRRREAAWVPVVLAFTSFALLAGQSYGGEAIFRVYLYSLPGCLLLVAPPLTSLVTRRRATGEGLPRLGARSRLVALTLMPVSPARVLARVGRLLAMGLVALVTVASLQSYYGTWFTNVVDRDGLVAEEHLLATAPTYSMILPLTTGIAERPSGRYADFAEHSRYYDVALVLVPHVLGARFTPTQFAGLTYRLRSLHVPIYIVISEGMRRYAQYYGLFPPGAVDRLVSEFRGSPFWNVLTDTPTLSIFQLSTT